MDQNQNQSPNDEFPWRQGNGGAEPVNMDRLYKKDKKGVSLGLVALIVCIAVVFSAVSTYSFTSAWLRDAYVDALLEEKDDSEFAKLEFLSQLFEEASYYAGKVSPEERLEFVLKAYAASPGDKYAEYYTEEEYAEMLASNVGSHVGIGVSVIHTEVEIDNYAYVSFEVISVFQNSPAQGADIRVGDYIVALKVDDVYLTISELGGYTQALNAIRGEEGSTVELLAFRKNGEEYDLLEFSLQRGTYVTESVTYAVAEGDPSVGIVRIMEFNLTTPNQFKAAMQALGSAGVTQYVFDLRNNPGGDLLSIKAVLSYFLEEGDLILSSVNNKGETVRSHYATPQVYSDEYSACNVFKKEIGMYRGLDAVVLCNNNTASAAEVFVATMRDYGLAPVVGETTYGKGIMQTVIDLSIASGGVYEGHVKLTTYAYVTKCGVTYHEIGIKPTAGEEISLSEEALSYHFNLLPQSLDNQLQAAIAEVKK